MLFPGNTFCSLALCATMPLRATICSPARKQTQIDQITQLHSSISVNETLPGEGKIYTMVLINFPTNLVAINMQYRSLRAERSASQHFHFRFTPRGREECHS